MKKLEISNLKFIIIYSIYSFFVLNIPLFIKFFKTLSPESIGDYIFSLGLLISCLSLSVVFFSLFFQKYITKFAAICFLIISSVVSFFTLFYNIPINSDMVENAFSTDMNEMRDLISFQLIVYLLFFGILPSIIIAFFIKIKYSFAKNLFLIVVCLLLSIVIIFLLYFKIAAFFRVNRGINDYFTPLNYIGPVYEILEKKLFVKAPEEEHEVTDARIKNLSKNLNIVLIIGETARKKNFSLYGYKRETNPLLQRQKDLKVLDPTISCSTSTRFSIPCIFNPNSFTESFLTTLQRLGVWVKWYENNYGGCYGACNKLNHVFKINHSDCSGSCPDGLIFEEFYKDIENGSGKRLFVLHQNGSHGPLYYKRYPVEFIKFTPECQTSSVNKCSKEELINAYDNTILYTDYLIYHAIENLKKSKAPSVLIYISDHGESLGENGIFLHGFPYKIAPREQKEIPFLIWSTEDLVIKNLPEYTHKQILHTIFKLLEVSTSVYVEEENIIQK
jgi:lipid A ethanolaminephosphotransferase